MNIITTLKREKEKYGKDVVLPDGSTASTEKIREKNLKTYVNGIKNGSIDAGTSFDDYNKKATDEADYLSIDELIEYIQGDEVADNASADKPKTAPKTKAKK